ncbi:unnamed protein product [Lactuca virosa]|uniref:Disease resistance protein At4g27190-like leucine-rich repeats domain-containing protein n=1 Tax=Lactuca virosa TaxID=75947 RepID=A0AAU9M181_9ASTR|nr:unnamed protein product [Lactuca virosa]
MVGSLKQLKELSISNCHYMEEVVVKDENIVVEEEEEESDGKMSELMLPCLKSLKLYGLSCLKGFFVGKADFSFPLLDTLIIIACPAITTFTMGNSSTPELKGIKTDFGSFYVEEDINSFIKMKQEVAFQKILLMPSYYQSISKDITNAKLLSKIKVTTLALDYMLRSCLLFQELNQNQRG